MQSSSQPATAPAKSGYYPARPDQSVVQDFLAHVAKTGAPHAWPQHTHTRPPQQATPVLLKQFDLPEAFAKAPGRRAICPICQPTTAKYTWGYLSWYPESAGGDGRIRAIGHDCGSRFFGKERYQAALDVLRREQDEHADRDYIRHAHQFIEQAHAETQALRLYALAHDDFRAAVVGTLGHANVKDLMRRAAGGGALSVNKMRPVVVTSREGISTTRMESVSERVATAAGLAFFSERANGLASALSENSQRFDIAIGRLGREADTADTALSAAEAGVVANALRASFKTLAAARAALSMAAVFASVENLRQLQRWTCHPDSDAAFKLILRDDGKTLSLIMPKRRGAPQLGMKDAALVLVPEALRMLLPPASPHPK